MKPHFLLPLTAMLAAGCDGKNIDGDANEGDTVILKGQAFTLVLQPVMPPEQVALYDTLTALEVKITQGDGTVSTHALGEGDTGSAASGLPPLDGATVSLSGKRGQSLLLWGQTPALDLSEGKLTQRITLAALDTLTPLGDLPVGLGFGAMAAGPDGRFFLFGGAEDGFIEQTPSAHIYELRIGAPEDTLQPRDLGLDLPDISDGITGRMGHTATLFAQDTPLSAQILITGGTSTYVPEQESTFTWAGDQFSSDQAFLFDTETETLTEVPGLAYPRYGHVAVENHKGEIVIIGGFNDQGTAFTQPYAEVFDPEDQVFRQVSGILTSGTGFHAAARLGQQGIMSCGGVTFGAEPATDCAIVQASGEATTMINWPGPPVLSPIMVTMADDRILLTGGLDLTGWDFDIFCCELEAIPDAWIFESGAWQAVEPMVHPRAWHTAVPLPDGRVLITGGVTRIVDDGFGPASLYWGTAYDPGAAVACAEIFDPETGRFSELDVCLEDDPSSSLPTRTLLAGSAVDPIHGALIMGGVDQTGNGVPSVMFYRPQPDL